ncbi:MAG: D-2-hydroxyacid dehydrogenase [Halobacteriales archaeon]
MSIDHFGIHPSVDIVFPPERIREALADLDATVSIVDESDLADVDAIVTGRHYDAFFEDLEWVHVIFAGLNHFPVDAYGEAGVAITNSSGIHGTAVGETVTGYLTMLARDLHTYSRQQTNAEWHQTSWDSPFTLEGETICVVGLGALGRGIAEHAVALGMHVTGIRRSDEPVEGVETLFTPDELHEAIADARFVALAVPLTDATRNLIGPAEFECMRDDSYLINVARGGVVDQAALIEALRTDTIAGAALDVFEKEPLPAESPLWDFEDVIITPHRAAVTEEYYALVADLVRENVARLTAGEPMINRVR